MKNPVSSTQNSWYDSQEVDNNDLQLEQNFNNTVQSAIINNNIGTGVIPEVLTQNILFNSSLVSGFLDGKPLSPQNQPIDNSLGNQLELTLTDSLVFGKRTVKVCIIGLDFAENVQFETFVFKRNESQVSKKHFTKILTILVNDIFGVSNKSFNLGGNLLIKEAKPFSLSRDAIMVSQELQPNLFFRDFFLDGFNSIESLIQNAMPLYNIDNLNIKTSELDNKALVSNDITTQIGQKFIAKTNNIQKVTLLLSVRNLDFGNEDDLNWTGDLIISIYPLQSIIECSDDIAPNLPIEFAPSNIPLAQLSLDYASLQDAGVVLDSVPQPVDFIFSNTPIANGSVITEGAFYAVALKRAGSADKCDILIANGGNLLEDSRITTFTGSLWVDLPEEDLWFKVWTDSAKVSDGQAYDSGNGIIVEKTIETLNAVQDYCLDNLNFSGNNVFKAVVQAAVQQSNPVPDQRTGNSVFSIKQFVPEVKLLNSIDIDNLESISDPLIIGSIADKNRKFYNAVTSTINSKLYSSTIVNNEIVIKIVDDPTDVVRFDSSVSTLGANLLNGDFINAKFTPNITEPNVYYRIASSSLCSMIFGDVNGDGIVDESDLELLNSFIGYNLNVGLLEDSFVTTDGYTTTYSNGYDNVTQPFTTTFNLAFQVLNGNTVVASGSDGILVADPNNKRLARFTSASVNFTAISDLTNKKIAFLNPALKSDYGAFDITAIDSSDIITVRKIFLDAETIKQMLRADIDGDFYVTNNDGYLLGSYIDRLNIDTPPTPPYPAPTSNAYDKIGKRFNVISFKLEKYIDRSDDYTSALNTRNADVHSLQYILSDGYVDGYNVGRDYYSSPVSFSIQKKLTWDESLIVTSSHPRFVPNVFNDSSGYIENSCDLNGIICNIYPPATDHDPGKVDYFFPNNVIIGDNGQIHNPDGSFYKVDYEIGTIVLEIPDGMFGTEQTINLMDDFITDYNGEGITRLGFKAMRFADCSFVTTSALSNNQIRFSASIQSFSPNTNGISEELLSGPIVDGKMGVSIDYATGVLTINFTNLYQDSVMKTLSTKVQITVFLKKGGFNNLPVFVDSVKVQNLLQLTSIFSGGGVSGVPSISVDLEEDVFGILSVENGGTGLTTPASDGYTVVSIGGDLVYTTMNPLYVYGISGVHTTTSASFVDLGALTFRLDKIAAGYTSITFEAIMQTNNASNAVSIALYNETLAAYVNLDGITQNLTTTSTTAALVKSSNLTSLLGSGAVDYIYSVRVLIPGGSTATIKSARLVVSYE